MRRRPKLILWGGRKNDIQIGSKQDRRYQQDLVFWSCALKYLKRRPYEALNSQIWEDRVIVTTDRWRLK